MTWPTTKLSKTGMVIEEETSEHEEAIRLRLLPCLPRGKAWRVCKAMRLFPSRATLSDLGTNAAMLLLMWTACKHIQFFLLLAATPLSHLIPKFVACMGVLKMHRVRECIFLRVNLSSHKIIVLRLWKALALHSLARGLGYQPGAMQLSWRCQASFSKKKKCGI